jgi:hypothetical protein
MTVNGRGNGSRREREREALTDWTEQPSESREDEGGGGASFHSGGGCAGRGELVSLRPRAAPAFSSAEETRQAKFVPFDDLHLWPLIHNLIS